jgi:HPt (histidine-containing phosphotransfer) domain-containing protein
MTVRELYETLGGDYKEAMSRLMNDQFASLMLKKFLANNEYGKMAEAFAQGDRASAFRYSHNLKGVALNLGLNRLGEAVSALCEIARDEAAQENCPPELLEKAAAEYEAAASAIRSLG